MSEVRMQYTDDGQENWSNWQAESIGDEGQYGKRIPFTRLGQFTQRVITFESAANRKRDVLAVVGYVEGTP